MIAYRAKALAPAFLLLAVLVAPPAAADTAADCAILRKAAGGYSKLADSLSALRKAADEQQEDPVALTATQRKVVALAREMGDTLHKLQVKLDDPVLSYVYDTDSKSFNAYADTLEGAVNNGDISGTNIHVTRVYSRNVDATEAANDAYHAQCK